MIGFPRRPRVELYLNGWTDVTNDVRQSPGITITRGRKDQSAKPSPSKCSFTLDDAAGAYNARNPNSPWYGRLSRNLPVRVGLQLGADDFGRTVASGWGTSTDLGTWTDVSSAGTTASSVASNEGRHTITSTTAYRASHVGDVNVKNVDVAVSVTINGVSSVTGGDLEPANILLRGGGTYYMLRVTITTLGSIELRIMAGDSQTLAGPYTVQGTSYNGSTLRVRFQADANTFRGKVWTAASPEPATWDLFYSHGDVFGAGWIGVRSGVGGGNTNSKPIVFRYDDLDVTIPRFAGETSSMMPLTELDHSDRTVTVTCAGIMRRLQQGAAPLHSSPRRYLTSPNSPLTWRSYWPLEEIPDEVPLGRNLGGGVPARFDRFTDVTPPTPPTGAVKWHAATGLPPISGAPELTNGGKLTMLLMGNPLSTSWSVTWWQRIGADTGANVWIRCSVPEDDISFIFYTDGTYEVYRITTDPFSSDLLFAGTMPLYGSDDVWHLMTFGAVDAGANVRYYIGIDDQADFPDSVLYAQAIMPFPARFEMFVDTGTTQPSAVGHVVLYDEDAWTNAGDYGIWRGFNGYVGETAAQRFTRLCSEEGVSYGLVGYDVFSTFMGPQTPKPLLDLLFECVDADQGSLYEPRGDAALVMRTTRSLIGRDPVLTLDYAAGEVAGPFGPTDDDTDTVNDVTAKRTFGGRSRYEQTTGPLNTAAPGTRRGAVGRYDAQKTVNLRDDGLLADVASWAVHMGTIDEARYPTVTVDLTAEAVSSNAALTTSLLDVDIDDALLITNAQAALIYDDVRQIVRGYVEKFDTAYRHTIQFNTTPAAAYDAGNLDETVVRLSSDTSALAANVTSTATSITVTTTHSEWSGADQPFDITVGGERMTVTAVTGGRPTQTFTVTRSVNGVVKAQTSGAAVALAAPVYLAP